MNLQIGSFNMGMQPIPYKYLIAPALLGYALYSLHAKPSIGLIRLLMIPAALYGMLRCYWLYNIFSGENPMIIKEAYDAGFFTINEITILLFNLTIGLVILKQVRSLRPNSNSSFGTTKYWKWLRTLPGVFVVLSVIHLLLIFASYALIGDHDRLFYYPTLVVNSIFVYWIGFVGYSRSGILFFKPLVKDKSFTSTDEAIDTLLKKAMNEDQLYKNPKLTAQQLATAIALPTNELTRYINTHHEVNVSQYLNRFRTQEAIELMKGEFLGKYSLEALAIEAGFNSKSSFYKVFKDQTGKTPSAYLKSIDK